MKKFAIFASICAVALTMTSCDLFGGSKGGDVDAVYEAETFDVDDEGNIVDPNDEQAYAMYAFTEGDDEEAVEPPANPGQNNNNNETEPDIPTGPSDVDMVNVHITEPHQVDWLLDEFDYDINHLREIMKDQASNAADIQATTEHIIMITDKMNEAAEDGVCTEAHLARYQKQADAFLEIVNK